MRFEKYLIQEISDPPKMGINVRNEKGNRFADLIVDGRKYYETRETDSLKPYIGKRIAIVRTGEGKAMAIGEVTVGKPLHVTSKEEFDKLRPKHLVPDDSKFGFKTEKYLYPMLKPMRYQKEYRVRAKGIISRQIPYFLIKLVEYSIW